MAGRVRIAAAQTLVTADPARNGATIRDTIRNAAEAGARLVHFPEGGLSGYAGQLTQAGTGWQVDWTAVRRELRRTAELAGQLGIWVVVGGGHQLSHPHRPHNSLWIINDRGHLVDRYDKRLLSDTERRYFNTPGTEPRTFDIDGFRFGCLICIEVNFPELWLEQERLGVDCVLFASFSEDPQFDVLVRGHAAANCYWVSTSVPAQHSGAMPAGVVGPDGRRLADAPADGQPALVCADLDRTDPALDIALRKARPWRRLARTGEPYANLQVNDDPRSTDRTTI